MFFFHTWQSKHLNILFISLIFIFRIIPSFLISGISSFNFGRWGLNVFGILSCNFLFSAKKQRTSLFNKSSVSVNTIFIISYIYLYYFSLHLIWLTRSLLMTRVVDLATSPIEISNVISMHSIYQNLFRIVMARTTSFDLMVKIC